MCTTVVIIHCGLHSYPTIRMGCEGEGGRVVEWGSDGVVIVTGPNISKSLVNTITP